MCYVFKDNVAEYADMHYHGFFFDATTKQSYNKQCSGEISAQD